MLARDLHASLLSSVLPRSSYRSLWSRMMPYIFDCPLAHPPSYSFRYFSLRMRASPRPYLIKAPRQHTCPLLRSPSLCNEWLSRYSETWNDERRDVFFLILHQIIIYLSTTRKQVVEDVPIAYIRGAQRQGVRGKFAKFFLFFQA